MISQSALHICIALALGAAPALSSHAQTTGSVTAVPAETRSADAVAPVSTASPSGLPHTGVAGGLAVLRDSETKRVSSEDRAGNADKRQILPGEELTLAELEGPGEITHLWTTISTRDPDHLRNIVLRIYWDGNDYPSVEAPIGDFYGLGHGWYYYFSNPVQAIGTINGMNCFWPMPFAKSARVVAANQGTTLTRSFYYYVDWRKLPEFPSDAAYFHAQYRQAFPCEDGKNYLLLDTEGAPGHYVGVNLTIHTMSGGWWGEGDDIFTIDGEATPSMWGTGSEDYFCGAWGFGAPFYTDYFGMPVRQRMDQDKDNVWNVYRLHLENPVTFRNSIKVEIEHGASGFDNTRSLNNNYSSVAYWYCAKPVRLKGELPPAAQRISRFSVPTPPPGVLEMTDGRVKAPPSVPVEVQPMPRGDGKTTGWMMGNQVFARPDKAGQRVEIEFTTTQTLSGMATLGMTKAQDYGKVKIELDNRVLVDEFDGYAPLPYPHKHDVGRLALKPGRHVLVVTTTGRNQDSKGFFWGVDYLRVEKERGAAEKPARKPAHKRRARR